MKKFYNTLFILSPWFILLGMLQTNFQKFLPYQEYFKGRYFFDFYTVTDIFMAFLIAVFFIGLVVKKTSFNKNKIPRELLICVALLFIAGAIQILFQKIYEPILTAPIEYFRSMILYPVVYILLIFKTLDQKTINSLVISYILMIAIFCAAALAQYFFKIFSGVQYDFMGRLVWPYIDFVTLKWQSANWIAFFVTPGLIISFIKTFNAIKSRKFNTEFYIFAVASMLSAITIYFVQSYGAYAAIFAAIAVYLFRTLKFKYFLVALLCLILAAGGIYMIQKNSLKYKVLTGEQAYKYKTSTEARTDIYKMDLYIIKNYPLMGAGLNQYQSFFSQNKQILGRDFNELTIPPHAHNFFLSFWTSLGIFGVAAMLILIIGIFWRIKFNPTTPALFALIAIMTHGLIDSYYWKPEIAYTVWLVIAFSYLYNISFARKIG